MDWQLIGALGIPAGGLITWLVSRHYYSRATQDLRAVTANLQQTVEELDKETGRLKNLVILTLEALKHPGEFEIGHDGKGEIVRGKRGLPVAVAVAGRVQMIDIDPDESGFARFPPFVVARPLKDEHGQNQGWVDVVITDNDGQAQIVQPPAGS
jgi:hypothetical protein